MAEFAKSINPGAPDALQIAVDRQPRQGPGTAITSRLAAHGIALGSLRSVSEIHLRGLLGIGPKSVRKIRAWLMRSGQDLAAECQTQECAMCRQGVLAMAQVAS